MKVLDTDTGFVTQELWKKLEDKFENSISISTELWFIIRSTVHASSYSIRGELNAIVETYTKGKL